VLIHFLNSNELRGPMHLNVDSAIRAIQPNRALALSSAFERLIMVARNPANFLKTPQYHCVDPAKQLDLIAFGTVRRPLAAPSLRTTALITHHYMYP